MLQHVNDPTRKLDLVQHTIANATGTNGQRKLTNLESVQLLRKHIFIVARGLIPRRPLSPSARIWGVFVSVTSPLCVGRVSFSGDFVARVGSGFVATRDSAMMDQLGGRVTGVKS